MSRGNPLLGAALCYGRVGLKIFPILESSKDTPLIAQWGVQASSDLAQITQWWTRWPNANIGLACGPSRIGVVDSDVPNGEETLQCLADLEGKILSPTRTQRTPRGGIHRFYRGRLATTAGRIGQCVDTRGIGATNGGYVLLPPSRTANGSYIWEDKRAMAALDSWVADVCDAPTIGDNSQVPAIEQDTADLIAWAIHFLTHDAKPSIQFQNGEYTLLMTAAVLKDHGISKEMAIELLAEHFNPRCEPPWDINDGATADRLDVKVQNAWKYLTQTTPGAHTAQVAFADNLVDAAALNATVTWWKERAAAEANGEQPSNRERALMQKKGLKP